MLFFRWALLLGCSLLQALISQCSAEPECVSPECSPSTNWTSLWYVWLILLTIFLLLLCGITASCVKFCCNRKKRPNQALPQRASEVTVITVDNDSTVHSTIHSTVTSYSSLQYPHLFQFAEMDRGSLSPPAYSLYAMEMPPAYEEAIKMAMPAIDAPTTFTVQKLEDIPEHGVPESEVGQSEDPPGEEERPDEGEIPPSYEETGTASSAGCLVSQTKYC